MKITIESQDGCTSIKINGVEIPCAESVEFRHDSRNGDPPYVKLTFYPLDRFGLPLDSGTHTERTAEC